ncbi:MAG: hypothetical protein P8X73_11740, partial [Ignavibacteriaceae bacterium]
MKKLTYFFAAFVTVLITVSSTVQAQTLVGDWGLTNRGMGWPLLNTAGTPAGDAIMGGASAPTAWATMRGEFNPTTATVDSAIIVSGTLEYVGAGGGTSYVPLRYALTFQDSTTLMYQYTDSAQWVSTQGHWGYEFTPRTDGSDLANGAGGSGGIWTVRGGGGWNSTYSNKGYPFGGTVQAPRNAIMTAGTYDW